MRILIAINEINEINEDNSKFSEHLGHCLHFAIYGTDMENLKILENKLNHSNQNLIPINQVRKFKSDIVFSKGAGCNENR